MSMFRAFHKLTTAGLRELASLCEQRTGAPPPPTHVLQQIAGLELGDELESCLRALMDHGWRTEQLAAVARVLAESRGQVPEVNDVVDLVLSGPEAPGIATRDTAAVMHALLAEARKEVLLVGYAVHNARHLFESLAVRMTSEPELRVWFCLDIRRGQNDTSLEAEIIRRFANDFRTKHWPWEPKPEVYYDPRSLALPGQHRSSLHAKCVVVDRSAALITSANFTQAAHERNIEAGVIIRNEELVSRLQRYFEALCSTRQLLPCQM